MKYRIWRTDDSTGWIYISADGSFQEPDAFVALVKAIASSVEGEISSVGDLQYRIQNLPFDLVFQWDDLFGMVVINGDITQKNEVLRFLGKYGIVHAE